MIIFACITIFSKCMAHKHLKINVSNEVAQCPVVILNYTFYATQTAQRMLTASEAIICSEKEYYKWLVNRLYDKDSIKLLS
jgi:hypothetical protein